MKSISSSPHYHHNPHHQHHSSDFVLLFTSATLFAFAASIILYFKFIHPSSSSSSSLASAQQQSRQQSRQRSSSSSLLQNNNNSDVREQGQEKEQEEQNNNNDDDDTVSHDVENSGEFYYEDHHRSPSPIMRLDASNSPSIAQRSASALFLPTIPDQGYYNQEADKSTNNQQLIAEQSSLSTVDTTNNVMMMNNNNTGSSHPHHSSIQSSVKLSGNFKNTTSLLSMVFYFLKWIIVSSFNLGVLIFVRFPLRYGLLFVSSSTLSMWCLFQLDELTFACIFSAALFLTIYFISSMNSSSYRIVNLSSTTSLSRRFLLFLSSFFFSNSNDNKNITSSASGRSNNNNSSCGRLTILMIWMSLVFGVISTHVLLESTIEAHRPSIPVVLDDLLIDEKMHRPFKNYCNKQLVALRRVSLFSFPGTNFDNEEVDRCLPSTSLFRRHSVLEGLSLKNNKKKKHSHSRLLPTIELCRGASLVLAGDSVRVSHLSLSTKRRNTNNENVMPSSPPLMYVLGNDVILENLNLTCTNNARTISSSPSSMSFLSSPCIKFSESALETVTIHNLRINFNDELFIVINSKKQQQQQQQQQRKSISSEEGISSKDDGGEDTTKTKNRPPSSSISNKFSFFWGTTTTSSSENEQEVEESKTEEENEIVDFENQTSSALPSIVKQYLDVRYMSSSSFIIKDNSNTHNNINNPKNRIIDIFNTTTPTSDEEEHHYNHDNLLYLCASYPKRFAMILPVGLSAVRVVIHRMFPVLTTLFNDHLIPAFKMMIDASSDVAANIGCGVHDVRAHHKSSSSSSSSSLLRSLENNNESSTSIGDSVVAALLPPQDQPRVITVIWSSKVIICEGSSTAATNRGDTSTGSKTGGTVHDDRPHILVPYLSPIRTVFRELSIAISWFATSVWWRIIVWCCKQELQIVLFILDVLFSYFFSPVFNFIVFSFLVETVYPVAVAAFSSADWQRFFMETLLPTLESILFNYVFSALSFVGKYYFSYVMWARDMEFFIYGYLWEPLQTLISSTISFTLSYLMAFLASTSEVSFKIHFLLSAAQTGLLIFSVRSAYKHRQMKQEERERLRRERESSTLSSTSSSALSFTSSIASTFSGFMKSAARTSHQVLVQGNFGKVTNQLSMMMSVSRWYDQLSTFFSANLWYHCLEFAVITLLLLVLRFAPLPTSTISFILEAYFFPIYTTMSFSRTFAIEFQNNFEKNLTLLVEEEVEKSTSHEKIQFLVNEAEEEMIEKKKKLSWLMDDDVGGGREGGRVSSSSSSPSSQVLIRLGMRMFISAAIQYLFGAAIDRIVTEIMNLLYFLVIVAILFALVQMYRSWTWMKSFFGDRTTNNNNNNDNSNSEAATTPTKNTSNADETQQNSSRK